MRKVLRIRILAPLALFTLALAMLMAGCSNDQRGSVAGPDVQAGAPAEPLVFDKKGDGGDVSWPITASGTFWYESGNGGYRGGSIRFGANNKSKFQLEDWSLTPPASFPPEEDITLTMTIDYDSTAGELTFLFGPHGCQFSPRAQLKMDYQLLGVDAPVLYYIDENGNRIQLQPDQINVNEKWIKIRLDHFSRYALARS